jgi:hypothetical protein
MAHANAALTPRHRLRLARLIVEDGWPPSRAAEFFNVSWRTAAKWAQRYRDEGSAELGDDPVADQSAIDYFIDVAVQGLATAFRLGRGGCVEVRDGGGKSSRSWPNAWPWPGWRTRAERVAYVPYA